MQLERRRDLANGRQGRFQAACRLGRDLPAQAKSDKSQGVRGTESPDSINQTLKKTEKLVSVFSGEVQRDAKNGPVPCGPRRPTCYRRCLRKAMSSRVPPTSCSLTIEQILCLDSAIG